MNFIEPHIHMVCRTTDEYMLMAKMGCVAVSEPSFWAGFDRRTVEGFRDYFEHITGFEPKRAAWHGIQHYAWLCINAKEAEDVVLSREVIAMIPEFLDRPGVLGLGEIGLNKNTKNEVITFLEHLELAAKSNEQLLIHTPHLADKYQGTRMTIDMVTSDQRIDRNRVLIDHLEEHTIRPVLDAGFWGGLTLYPITKCTPARAADLIEMYGPECLLVNSAADWGPSNPLAVTDFIQEMRRRKHPESLIHHVVYENPLTFFGQSRNFVSI